MRLKVPRLLELLVELGSLETVGECLFQEERFQVAADWVEAVRQEHEGVYLDSAWAAGDVLGDVCVLQGTDPGPGWCTNRTL